MLSHDQGFRPAFPRHFCKGPPSWVVLRQRLLVSEGRTRGCNQATYSARFSVLLRIDRTCRKVTHARALIYRYSACQSAAVRSITIKIPTRKRVDYARKTIDLNHPTALHAKRAVRLRSGHYFNCCALRPALRLLITTFAAEIKAIPLACWRPHLKKQPCSRRPLALVWFSFCADPCKVRSNGFWPAQAIRVPTRRTNC